MEFDLVLQKRKMCRSFRDDALTDAEITSLARAALRGPSAGFSQGIEYLILTTEQDRRRFWENQIDVDWLSRNPSHRDTQAAPLLLVVLSGPTAYLTRYAMADKGSSGLHSIENWPVPFWIFDAGASAMAVLLKAVDLGLAAGFFGIFRNQGDLAAKFNIPAELIPVGVIAVGHAKSDNRLGSAKAIPRRDPATQLHAGEYGKGLKSS